MGSSAKNAGILIAPESGGTAYYLGESSLAAAYQVWVQDQTASNVYRGLACMWTLFFSAVVSRIAVCIETKHEDREARND
jgi:hypothetical protein